MNAEESYVNASIDHASGGGLAIDVYVPQIGDNLTPDATTATPRVSNQTSEAETTLRSDEICAERLPPTTEQVWDTLLKINSMVDKLQQAYSASRTENHANFVDVEKRMKALENSNETTL